MVEKHGSDKIERFDRKLTDKLYAKPPRKPKDSRSHENGSPKKKTETESEKK